MASLSELINCLQGGALKKDPNWLNKRLSKELANVSNLRGGATVIFYASAFLQKNAAGSGVNISREDINGFMNALHGMKTDKGLTLILHTPGGDPNAVESIVEYLHGNFSRIEVIVPYLAMSGGTMISLASDLLALGRQSQLGPIDPQLSTGGKAYSARAIREGFNQAREDIEKNTGMGHLWAPILQNMGPSLAMEAEKALSYSRELVVRWMKRRMFKDMEDEALREKTVNGIAAYFNAEDTAGGTIHVHGQRIGAEKLRELGVRVEMLEDTQELQTAVMTAYHLMTLIFERTLSSKFIADDGGKMWFKQQSGVQPPAKLVPAKPVQKKG
ncbi:MAG: hypothetical protein OXF42_06610 [Candidatus Dadabacteria bacterium]|nr:hypothetical protein [Candidatus Dadabacteria bacterium]